MIEGFCDPRFAPLREVFERSFEGDDADMRVELGASVALYLDGAPVVDLWGGWQDAGRTAPWRGHTIVCVQSVGKGILATLAHMLVERGQLDLDAPIARYWPQFAAKGKADLPVRWALSHALGMPAWEAPAPGMAYDWERATEALADSKPDLRPGVDLTYHPYTYGFIVGELVRRVSGKPVDAFLRDELTGPLDLDFQYGVRPADVPRTATFTRLRHGDNLAAVAQVTPEPYADIARRSLDVLDPQEDYNTPAWRGSVQPAANGHTNARALARLYGALAEGGALGRTRVLKPQTLEAAVQRQWGGRHLIIPMTANMALGYILNSPSFPSGPNADSFGHAGFGGAFGFADRRARLGFGYTPNKMWIGEELNTGARCEALVQAAYGCLAAVT
jgi:CubicO group peptidase (beta-lactamase class C family)